MISFDTKDNLKKRREEAFLALEPEERVDQFLKMIDAFSIFTTRVDDRSDHFVLEKRS